MTSRNLFESLRGIDDSMILDAAPDPHRHRRVMTQLRRGAIAACLALTVLTGSALTVLSLGHETAVGGVTRRYKFFGPSLSATEGAISWRWEYLTTDEKYPRIMWNGTPYITSHRTIGEHLLGEILGTCTAQNTDEHTDTQYTETFEVRAVGNISPEKVVALGLDGTYYVYQCDDKSFPATWGEVLDAYDLENILTFSRFSVEGDREDDQSYTVTDDAHIWQVLSACRDAQWLEDTPQFMIDKNYISFTVTCEQLGVYKKVFYVTEDGYIRTNIFRYAYTFRIGEEASREIIDYVTANAEKAAYEPYENTVAGTLVEIGDGYILVDDSILCAAFGRGKVFRVLTDDIRISRVVDSGHAEVGDIVVVSFTDDVVITDGDYVIDSATDMNVGYISEDGGVSVPE